PGQGKGFVDNPPGYRQAQECPYRMPLDDRVVENGHHFCSYRRAVVRALVNPDVVRKPWFPELRVVKTCKDGRRPAGLRNRHLLSCSRRRTPRTGISIRRV